jgi:hypothetical protein
LVVAPATEGLALVEATAEGVADGAVLADGVVADVAAALWELWPLHAAATTAAPLTTRTRRVRERRPTLTSDSSVRGRTGATTLRRAG